MSLHVDIDSLVVKHYDDLLFKHKNTLSIIEYDFKQLMNLGFFPVNNNRQTRAVYFRRSEDKKKIAYYCGPKIPFELIESLQLELFSYACELKSKEKAVNKVVK